MPSIDRLALRLDLRGHTPIFVQLVEGIKYHIATGGLVPGDQLPPVRRLADHLGINPNTVDRAYQELIRLQLAESQHGRGTFITGTLPPETPPQDREARRDAAIRELVTSLSELGYSKTEILTAVIQQLHLE